MCSAQCVLAVVALYVGVADSWDFAVSSRNHLLFYSYDATETTGVRIQSQNVTGLAFDAVHNRMLYVDKQNNNDAICGFNITSEDSECFIEKTGRNILSIAYDPVTEKLFFTDANEKSINWISLKRGFENNKNGHLLIKMDDSTPDDIAVDSCRGYIYWSKIGNVERARFDGSGRETLFDTFDEFLTFYVTSLTIDPQKQKIYYFDYIFGAIYLNLAHMNGTGQTTLFDIQSPEAKELTVSKDYFYFMTTTSAESEKSVWRFPKNSTGSQNAKEIKRFSADAFVGIATNYKIEDQIMGVQDCDSLSNLMQTVTEAPVNTGERLDVCVNYCLHGNCSVNDEGLPKCSCNAGYSGERCEVLACNGYCLNDGECSLNEEDDPVCQCAGNYEGQRCEADVTDTTPTYGLAKRNLTVADLVSIWGKHASRMFITFEVQP